jgi:hypothetical protein
MTADTIDCGRGVRGHVTLWRIDEKTGLKVPLFSQPNQIQYSWGYIAAKQLGFRRQPDRPDYHISAMYIEYENQLNPVTPISAAAFPRDLDISYYNALVDNTTRNFIRVPLSIEPALSVSEGYEANLPVNQSGNQLTFFAQTAEARVVYSGEAKEFSSLRNSKVYSAALVAAPALGDRTKDVIFARTVFAANHQVTKEASSQIGITWDIAFL